MIEVRKNEPITKKEFVESVLAETLRNADINVKNLHLSADERKVLIIFKNGYGTRVDIEDDSFGAIIMDVTRKAMY